MEVLGLYDLGELVEFEKNERGYVNTSFAIQTLAGGVTTKRFFRRYKVGVKEEELLFEHSVVERLVACGSPPVACIAKTKEGKSFVVRAEGGNPVFYAIFDYLPGDDRYTWVAPHCTRPELVSAARVLAQFHSAVSDLLPAGQRAEPRIAELLLQLSRYVAECLSGSKGAAFDQYLCEHQALIQESIARMLGVLNNPEVKELPQLVVHCDYHPGNLKFQGEQVSGLFDFDWSKIDMRSFDLGLALWYFTATWEGERDGELRTDELEGFLAAYQEALSSLPGIGPLSEVELRYLPDMIAAGNLYVLNWTIQDYYHKDVDPQEYLVYLRHGVNFIKKYCN
jgi:homoserine kinase type II